MIKAKTCSWKVCLLRLANFWAIYFDQNMEEKNNQTYHKNEVKLNFPRCNKAPVIVIHTLLFMFSALNSITSKHSTSSETRFTTTSSKKGSKETNTRNYLRARFYISRMLLFFSYLFVIYMGRYYSMWITTSK